MNILVNKFTEIKVFKNEIIRSSKKFNQHLNSLIKSI